jgi:hypothetical protein
MRVCEREELRTRIRASEDEERETPPRRSALADGALSVSLAARKGKAGLFSAEWMTGGMVIRCQALRSESVRGRVVLQDRLRQSRELRSELQRLVEELRDFVASSVSPPTHR